MRLYKFKRFNCHSIRMMKKGEIYISTPSKLNDPLDCALLESWIDLVKSRLQEKYGDDHLGIQPFTDPITQEVSPLLDAVKTRLARTGVFSLCGRCDDPLMWSHYGDEHRGICVGFDCEKLEQLIDDEEGFNKDRRFIGLFKVNYEPIPPYGELIERIMERNHISGRPVHSATTLFVDSLVRAMATKSDHWEYEEEQRILMHLSRENNYESEKVRVPLECIAEVNVGFRVPPTVLHQVDTILSDSALKHVEFNRMEFVEDSFLMRKKSVRRMERVNLTV